MKELLIILPLLFVCFSLLQSQTIQSKKAFGGKQYTHEGNVLSMGEKVDILVPYPEAQTLMKKAQSNNTASTILGVIDGGLVGQAFNIYNSQVVPSQEVERTVR